jgi:hypothetical protein
MLLIQIIKKYYFPMCVVVATQTRLEYSERHTNDAAHRHLINHIMGMHISCICAITIITSSTLRFIAPPLSCCSRLADEQACRAK